MSFRPFLDAATSGKVLLADQMRDAIGYLLEGKAKPVEIATFLTALKMRGETAAEIAAAAEAMRQASTRFEGPAGAIDTCGTGGDGAKTWNISTAVAFVLAGCGVPVAKHGNKAVSSASGSSDILSEMGINLMADFPVVQEALSEIGIAFLFAQRHHPAVRHVAPVRADMGVRTLFNVLGPLTNPAGAEYQLLGVYEKDLCTPIVRTLQTLGTKAAWVVHGSDGLDELTLTGPSYVAELFDGKLKGFTVTPEDFGLKPCAPEALIGGDVVHNAQAFEALLEGERGAYRDIVLMNAAAGLLITGKETDKFTAMIRAAQSIDSGAAKDKLAALIKKTNT